MGRGSGGPNSFGNLMVHPCTISDQADHVEMFSVMKVNRINHQNLHSITEMISI